MSLESDWDTAVPVGANPSGDLKAQWDKAEPVKFKAPPPAAKPKASAVYDVPPVALGEATLNMGTGMLAKPASDIAGLGLLAREMMTGEGRDIPALKRSVQESMTYEPRGTSGQNIAEYNPLALIGKLVGWGADKAQQGTEWVGGKIGLPPPVVDSAGRGVHEAVEQGPGLVGVKKGGTMAAKLPERQAALDLERTRNAPLDEIRDRSQSAGLTTPPEGTSWLAGIPGMAKLGRVISAKNQPEFNRLIAEQFKLPEGTAVTSDALKSVRAQAGRVYQEVVDSGFGGKVTETPPPVTKTSPIVDARGKPIEMQIQPPPVERTKGLPSTPEFKAKLTRDLVDMEKRIAEQPETFRAMKPSARLLREYLDKAEFDPRTAMDSIRQLRADATTNFRSTNPADRASGFTRMEVANALEDLFEANLAAKNPALMDKFKDARKRIAQSYDVEKVIDSAGNVDGEKLAALSKRRPLSENLEIVAQYAEQFPKGAKKVTEGVQGMNPFDWMFLVAAGPVKGGIELAGRVGIPKLAEGGFMQNKTPNYTANGIPPNLVRLLGLITSGAAGGQIPPPPTGQ